MHAVKLPLVVMAATQAASRAIHTLELVRGHHPDVLVPLDDGVKAMCRMFIRLRIHLVRPKEQKKPEPEVPRIPQEEVLREAAGCKTLLLEIVRRAAYDWVLYRTSRRMPHRQYAEDAYLWMFVEDADHPRWKERVKEDKSLTGFLSICEMLDLDPDTVRQHVRRLTAKKVMSAGRPPDYRHPDIDDRDEFPTTVPLVGLNADSLEDLFDNSFGQ